MDKTNARYFIVNTCSFIPSGLLTLQITIKLSPSVSSSQNGKILRNTMPSGKINTIIVRYAGSAQFSKRISNVISLEPITHELFSLYFVFQYV